MRSAVATAKRALNRAGRAVNLKVSSYQSFARPIEEFTVTAENYRAERDARSRLAAQLDLVVRQHNETVARHNEAVARGDAAHALLELAITQRNEALQALDRLHEQLELSIDQRNQAQANLERANDLIGLCAEQREAAYAQTNSNRLEHEAERERYRRGFCPNVFGHQMYLNPHDPGMALGSLEGRTFAIFKGRSVSSNEQSSPPTASSTWARMSGCSRFCSPGWLAHGARCMPLSPAP